MSPGSEAHLRTRDLIAAAVFNNAAWCDAVCRAHGHPGEFSDTLWLNRAQVPPFYPNAITLMPGGAVSQVDIISSLDVPGRWGVKDSFATLELASRGFTELFSAQWLHLASPPVAPASGARWEQVQDASMLAAWEAAWRGPPGDTPSDPAQSVFRPALLEDASIAFLAASLQGSLVAGAIAYRAAGVVSVSNTFFAVGAPAGLRAELLSRTLATFPGLPIVGYEHGEELTTWSTLGFQTLGPLRVWLKTAAKNQEENEAVQD
jgi:hypothetical protein